MRGAHVLTADGFDVGALRALFALADRALPFASGARVTEVLRGAVLASLFFEPSTRTRLSFGSAFARLGGQVLETAGEASSSIVKGETLADTARMLSAYADVIVLRHPLEGAVAELARASSVPVINGGDGAGEHPTQALLDLYTIVRERGGFDRLAGLRIVLVGDLKHGRTVHSLVRLLALVPGVRCTLVAPDGLGLPESVRARVPGLDLVDEPSLDAGLRDQDVVYVTRLQEERFPTKADAARFRGAYALDRARFVASCRPDTVLMHPLPRDLRPGARELSDDLDGLPNLAIFRQAANGVPIRMALFLAVLGAEDGLEAAEIPKRFNR